MRIKISKTILKAGGAVIAVVIGILVVLALYKDYPPIQVDLDAWWGPVHLRGHNDTSIRPFKVVFSDEMIKDLKYRLVNQREVVPPLEGVKFEYGFNGGQLYPWLKYWAEEYPFKEREDFLNQFPQYKTRIQGLDIHFIRVTPKVYPGKEIVPLLLLHGWPGSVREFYESIPLLTSVSEDRDFVIEVIAPSLPGFAFSDAAVRPGLGAVEMGVVFRNLMRRLGYEYFYIQGGDWGGYAGQSMATLFPKEVLGLHTNLGVAVTFKGLALTFISAFYPHAIVDPLLADRMYPIKNHLEWILSETGYWHIQATKPDTLGVAMSDSPGGLLAYLLQLISTGTRKKYVNRINGGLNNHYSRSLLIDNLMMYWVPNSITTSFRIYAETFNKRNFAQMLYDVPTLVPICTIQAKDEIIYQPPTVLKIKFPNLLNTTVLSNGGHFLPFEMPEVLADDVLKALTTFRHWHKSNTI